jgi:arabinose-5-phosphate isomerase
MDYLEKARRVIDLEREELTRLRDRLDESFGKAMELLRAAVAGRRKIIVCGVGKSGNIGHKLAATFNSTGATTVMLNAQDALHGDLGLVNEGDVALCMSYSGETTEMLNLLPHLRARGAHIVAMTGQADSTLARMSDVTLAVTVDREACPHNLAPTSSTTVMLVLGDALAMVLLEAQGFQREDFAQLHPGGSLGRVLLTKVSDIMRPLDRMALVQPASTVREALQAMTRVRSGAAVVIDDNGRMAGIFTHGDFVRAFQAQESIAEHPVARFMTARPVFIAADRLAAEALRIFEERHIDDLVVLDGEGKPVGMLDVQDLGRFTAG